MNNNFLQGRNKIREALSNYNTNKDQEAGYQLIRAMRNDIEVINGVTIEDMYNDKVAFNKLVHLAATV